MARKRSRSRSSAMQRLIGTTVYMGAPKPNILRMPTGIIQISTARRRKR